MKKLKGSSNEINNGRIDSNSNNKYKLKYHELQDTNKKLNMEITKLKNQIKDQTELKATTLQQKDSIINNLEDKLSQYNTEKNIHRTQIDILKTKISTLELSIQNDSSKILKLYRFLASISMKFDIDVNTINTNKSIFRIDENDDLYLSNIITDIETIIMSIIKSYKNVCIKTREMTEKRIDQHECNNCADMNDKIKLMVRTIKVMQSEIAKYNDMHKEYEVCEIKLNKFEKWREQMMTMIKDMMPEDYNIDDSVDDITFINLINNIKTQNESLDINANDITYVEENEYEASNDTNIELLRKNLLNAFEQQIINNSI